MTRDEGLLTIEERRAQRALRREKQRLENVGRGEKMHQARLAAEAKRLFPQDAASDDRVAVGQQFNIGCSGWYYWHWRDTFYPADLPSVQRFDHYADRFSTVELNAPFYSWPTVATVQKWRRQAEQRRFVYTVKVNELITHTKRFEGTQELVKDFGYIADLLGPMMGCFLFQLPPSHHFTPDRLDTVLRQLDPCRRNVVEFRHASWWNEQVYAAFRASGTIFCSCSGPRLPDELVKTADDIYVRFHGLKQWYRHDYTSEELSVWTRSIRASGANQVWAYFNNDRDGHAIKNGHELLRQLEEAQAVSASSRTAENV